MCDHPDALGPRRVDSFAMLPGIEKVLIIDSGSTRKRIGADVMTPLNDNIAGGAYEKRMPPKEITDVVDATKEAKKK